MTQALPKISCVVPVWNGETYLQTALDSIFAQSLPPDEVIVVDDGSTDGSAAVALRNAARGVRLIRKARGGSATARNLGIAEATGDLIAFLDADDLWLETKLERQMAALAAEPAAGCCFTLIDSFVEPGSDACMPEVLNGDRVGRIASTFLGRRDAIGRIGPMDETMRIRAEVEWFARFDDAGIPIAIVHERLAHRRLHDRNISRLHSAAAVDAAFDVIARRQALRHPAR